MGRRLACARRGSRAEQMQLVIPANTSPFSEFVRPWSRQRAARAPSFKLQASGFLRVSPSLRHRSRSRRASVVLASPAAWSLHPLAA